MSVDIRKHLPLLVFITLSLIWSSTWVAIKIGLQSLPPFLAAGLRFFLAFLVLFIVVKIRKIPIPSGWRHHLFFLMFGIVTFAGGYAFVYWGQQYIASGMASVLFSVMPFYVMIFSIWLLPQEKITVFKFTGVLLGFSGIVLIFWEQISFKYADNMTLVGMACVLGGSSFSALGTIIGKRVSSRINPIVLNVLPILYASVIFFILSIILEHDAQPVFDAPAIFSVIYLAVFGTATAFALYFWLIGQRNVLLISMITFVTPPLALIFGWIVFGEAVTFYLVIGLVLILTGIFLARH